MRHKSQEPASVQHCPPPRPRQRRDRLLTQPLTTDCTQGYAVPSPQPIKQRVASSSGMLRVAAAAGVNIVKPLQTRTPDASVRFVPTVAER
jgi:hypothetical protein